MAGVSSMLNEFQTWVEGLIGDRLDAALVQVRASVQRGTVDTELQPKVQQFANTLEAMRAETIVWLETAGPLMAANPDLEDRGRRMVFAYNTLHRQWTDKAATQRLAGDEQFIHYKNHVGVALTTVVLLTVAVGATAYAVTEVGAAWAISAQEDANKALAQIRLQEKDLQARVDASKDGRTLPPASVAPPSPSTWTGNEQMDAAAKLIVGVGLLAALGGAAAWMLGGARGRL